MTTDDELQWCERVEQLLREDGTRTLDLRDQLAATAGSRITHALGEVAATTLRDASTRIRAAFLLKDLCDPLAISYLERTLADPSGVSGLREAAIDALERLAFARLLPDLDLQRIAASLRNASEREHFIDLLLAAGTAQAQELLMNLAQDPGALETILSRAVALPGDWVDSFLDRLAADPRSTAQLDAAIAERAHRRLCAGLRQLGPYERVDQDILASLGSRHEFALIHWLAKHDHLDREASRSVLALDVQALSRSNRNLLNDAKDLLARSTAPAPGTKDRGT